MVTKKQTTEVVPIDFYILEEMLDSFSPIKEVHIGIASYVIETKARQYGKWETDTVMYHFIVIYAYSMERVGRWRLDVSSKIDSEQRIRLLTILETYLKDPWSLSPIRAVAADAITDLKQKQRLPLDVRLVNTKALSSSGITKDNRYQHKYYLTPHEQQILDLYRLPDSFNEDREIESVDFLGASRLSKYRERSSPSYSAYQQKFRDIINAPGAITTPLSTEAIAAKQAQDEYRQALEKYRAEKENRDDDKSILEDF